MALHLILIPSYLCSIKVVKTEWIDILEKQQNQTKHLKNFSIKTIFSEKVENVLPITLDVEWTIFFISRK